MATCLKNVLFQAAFKMKIKQITLIGVGLIGGSFVLDLKRQHCVERVIGIDVCQDNLERAIERRVIDVASTRIHDDSIAQSDLVLIATPVSTLPQICKQLAPILSAHTIVSDVGSTKQSTLNAFRHYLPQHFPLCVAAHPIAGSDRSGALAARFGLYQDKKLILCPHPEQNPEALSCMTQLWQAVGANVTLMDAEEHDQIFAAVSHLPHLLAFAYMNQILQSPHQESYLHFAGSGFKDFTRIAASHPQMWTDIALENREMLLHLLQEQQNQINQLYTLLENNNPEALYAYFDQASQVRNQWQNHHS